MTPEEFREQLELLMCYNPYCRERHKDCVLNVEPSGHGREEFCLYILIYRFLFKSTSFPESDKSMNVDEFMSMLKELGVQGVTCPSKPCEKCVLHIKKPIKNSNCLSVILGIL